MRRRNALRAGATLLGSSLLGGRGVANTADSVEPAGYEPLGRLDVEGTKETVLGSNGDVAYLALTDGYATVDVSDPANPTLLAERRDLRADTEAGAMRRIYDVKQSGDTLVVVGPAHPTDEGSVGALVVNVSDPAAPEERAFFETEYPIHNSFLDGSTLYLTANGAEGNPLVVVDVGGDAPTELARWALTDHDDAWRDVMPALRSLHDVWVRDGLAALAYWDAGTYLLDVSDPAAPEHLGTVPAGDPGELTDPPTGAVLTPPGNHHYVATDPANDLLVIGVESWGIQVDGEYEGGPGGVGLYDLSDRSAPKHLSTISPPTTSDPTYSGVWTTAHNLELRDGTLYTSWYQGGVKRHDVSDPANPVEETWWVDPDEAKFWTARVSGGGFFLASSMGTGNAPAGLFTFPDGSGAGGNPEALREPRSTTATDAVSSTHTPTFTPTPTPTATATSSQTSSSTASATTTSTPTEAAGFGALTALGGLGLTAWRSLGGREES